MLPSTTASTSLALNSHRTSISELEHTTQSPLHLNTNLPIGIMNSALDSVFTRAITATSNSRNSSSFIGGGGGGGEQEEDEFQSFERMNILLSNSSIFRNSYIQGNTWLFENCLKGNFDEIISRPPPIGQKIMCKIIRKKKGASGLCEYEGYLECPNGSKMFLLGAVRNPGMKCEYSIVKRDKNCAFLDQVKNNQICARIKTSILGLKFSILKEKPNGKQQQMAEVVFNVNVLGLKGPRKMNIFLPRENTNQDSIVSSNASSFTCTTKTSSSICLRNKPPQWNDESQSYILNFSGRVTMASVKNFQVIHDDDPDYIVLQFGKTSPNIFSMDYQYPMSALQAFGICLTSFDGKLACE